MKISDKRGQGATEYLLMLAAVLVIVAAAIYYVMTAGPSAIIAGSAKQKTGDNTVVIFTPTSMTPKTISADNWSWKVYRDATLVGSGGGSGVGDLKEGIPVELDCGNSVVQSGDKVKITYGGTTYDAAKV